MEAIGLIETRGLVAAIEAADAMLKAADVSLLERTYVGGSLISIAITGDVGAVKAAVEAGRAAVERLDKDLLVSQHTIPRPDNEIRSLISTAKEEAQVLIEEKAVEKAVEKAEQEKTLAIENVAGGLERVESKDHAKVSVELDYNDLNKEAIDKALHEHGVKETIEALKKTTVANLKKLAGQYSDFGMKPGKISKVNKKQLIGEFKKYYENN